MGKIRFGDLNAYGFSSLSIGERNPNGPLSWGAEYGILAVKTHLLASMNRLASAHFQCIDMAGRRLRRYAFEHILWLLQEVLDARVAV
jgi:hypothetical protein